MTDLAPTPTPPGIKELRNFGFTFGAVAGVVTLFQVWKGRTAGAWAFLGVALAFFLVGALFPTWLTRAYGPWMKFAEILGYWNTRLILGVFFFVGITPTGLLMRLAGKDPMSRTFKPKNTGSYWARPTEHQDGARHFERQF